jgi:hypothetical protein
VKGRNGGVVRGSGRGGALVKGRKDVLVVLCSAKEDWLNLSGVWKTDCPIMSCRFVLVV